MPSRRSSLALLCAVVALLGVPATASAAGSLSAGLGQGSARMGAFSSALAVGCAGEVPPVNSGDPDITPPTNTTPLSGSAWYTAPYTVTLSGTDSESGVDRIEWCINNGTVTTFDGNPITIAIPGVYTLDTRVIDVAGNESGWRQDTVMLDPTDPIDTTDSGTTGWRNTATSVTVTATDAVSGVDHVEWELDGVPGSGPSGSVVPIASDGVHTLRTRAFDVAGNSTDWVDRTVRVDTVMPVDTTSATGGWHTDAVAVTVGGVDGDSGIQQVTYQLDGAAPVTVASPSAIVNISADGDHVLTTKVRDAAGNETGWKTTNVHIDRTAPDNLTPTDDGSWRAADYSVMVSGADSGSGLDEVQWRVNGGAVTNGASPLQATVTGTGVHTLETRALDVAGNASAWRSETIRIDKVKPANTTTPPSGPVPNPYTVSVTGTDANSGVAHVEWTIDGGDVQSGPAGSQASVTGDGQHTLETRVVDNVGNASAWRTDTVEIDFALNADMTPPDDVTTTVPAGWRTNPLTITVAAQDAGVGMDAVQWRLPGKPIETRSGGSASLTFSEEGIWRLETRGRDLAGNESPWRLQIVRLDFTVPADTTDIPAAWQKSRTFAWSGTDALSGPALLEYTINGGSLQTASLGATVDVGADGIFTIEHRVLDAAGQSSDWSTHELKVDTVAPINDTPPQDPAWRTTPTIALAGSDALSGVEKMQWRLDGGAVQDGDTAVIDADGEHTLETRAVDRAGNDSGWRTDTVRVDVTAPVNETPAAPTAWRSTPYSVHVAGSDGAGAGVDKVEVKVDGGAISNDPDVTVTGDGVHTLQTRILDLVGKASAWRSETIKIDSVVPTAALTCPAGWQARAVSCTATANGGPSGIRSLTASRDGGAFTAVSAGAVPVATDGDHTITLKATDGAGNVKTAVAHAKVDRTRPVPALTCAPATAPTGYACRATGSDATSGLASLSYSLDGGAWKAVPAGGALSVLKGAVRVRAIDRAGNQALTGTVTLADRAKPPVPPTSTVRVSSVPVYLAERRDNDGMIGALKAARSANGTVSVDLRPLAVGRGTFKVQIRLASGKRHRTVTRTDTVGRGGTLRRMAASLGRASAKATVRLTVSRKAGRSWRRHASAKVVLAK